MEIEKDMRESMNDQQSEELMEEVERLKEIEKTRNAALKLLTAIECEVEIDENKDLRFQYQCEKFLSACGKQSIQIWDLGWFSLDKNAPELPYVEKAVNRANIEFGPTVLIDYFDESNMAYLHSHHDMVFSEEMNVSAVHTHFILNSFFDKKRMVNSRLNQLLAEQR